MGHRINLQQWLARFHHHVVIGEESHYITSHLGRDRGNIADHISVFGGDIAGQPPHHAAHTGSNKGNYRQAVAGQLQ